MEPDPTSAKEWLRRTTTIYRSPDIGAAREKAIEHLERSTPRERLNFAAHGCGVWGTIVEAIESERPGGDPELLAKGRELLRCYAHAYLAALKELETEREGAKA